MSEQLANKPEILVVDDSKVIRLAARKMLGNDYVIHLANDGSAAWELLQLNSNISVVFTDLIMPNVDGMQLLENIRNSSDEHIANLPVIIITGHGDTDACKQKVFDAGATDFISKPFESIDLVSRAKSYARLSRKVIELEKKTGYDKLTGLYNTSLMQEQGEKAIAFAGRHQLHISTIYFEIKDFQELFLSCGKNIAQHIIVAVGKRLHDAMREEDIAARIAVAKYSLILPMTNRLETEIVVNRVRESINKLIFDTGKEKIRVNFIAGYSSPELDDKIDFNEMLVQADTALQRAANSSTTHVVCFDDEVEEIMQGADAASEHVVGERDVDGHAVGRQVTDENVADEYVLEPVDSQHSMVDARSAAKPEDNSERGIENAFDHIMDGNYNQISDSNLDAVMEYLLPFLQYVEDKAEKKLSEREKNIAI